jgi:hypothetical protein
MPREEIKRRNESGNGESPQEERSEEERVRHPPRWVESLVDAVSGCMESQSPMGPLAFRWKEEDDDFVEVLIHPTPVELVKGAHDGEVVLAGFSVDLKGLSGLFERIDALDWRAHDFSPLSEGPCVWIVGTYRGHEISLTILSDPPEDEPPGLKVDTSPNKNKP